MADTVISASIQLRQDTSENWNGSSYILKKGEVGIAIDANPKEIRIGDGSNVWSKLTPNYLAGVKEVRIEGIVGSNENGTITLSGITASRAVSASYATSASYAAVAETVKASGGLSVQYAEKASTLVDSSMSLISLGNNTKPVYVSNGKIATCTLEIPTMSSIGGNIVPSTGSIYSLGSSTVPWKNAYINNITGSLLGTASYAKEAKQASSAGTAAYATSAGQSSYVQTPSQSYVGDKTGSTGTLEIRSVGPISLRPSSSSTTGSVVECSASIVPYGSEAWTLGNKDNYWREVYADSFILSEGPEANIYLNSDDILTVYSTSKILVWSDDDILIDGTSLCPSGSSSVTLGNSSSYWNAGYFKNIYTSENISASGDISAKNIYASGDVVAAYTSDRRLKDNIKAIKAEEADSVLQALNPVSFEWNKTEEKLTDGHRKGIARSFIADEFLQVLPNAGQKIYNGEYDAIYIEQVIPYLVAGYKKQQQEINELRKEIEELKAR